MGVEPAGGWTVLVRSIKKIAVQRAKDITHHISPKKCKNNKAVKVEIKCPPITFLGWEKGLFS